MAGIAAPCMISAKKDSGSNPASVSTWDQWSAAFSCTMCDSNRRHHFRKLDSDVTSTAPAESGISSPSSPPAVASILVASRGTALLTRDTNAMAASATAESQSSVKPTTTLEQPDTHIQLRMSVMAFPDLSSAHNVSKSEKKRNIVLLTSQSKSFKLLISADCCSRRLQQWRSRGEWFHLPVSVAELQIRSWRSQDSATQPRLSAVVQCTMSACSLTLSLSIGTAWTFW